MKHMRLSLSVLLTSAFISGHAIAAAFQFYELGAPVNGTAEVGQAVASTHDASTSYYNPAGMSLLPQSQFLLGAQPQLVYANFSPNTANTTGGNNGSNAGGFLPGVGGFYVYHYSPKLTFGASLTMPYGGSLNYDNHWVGRYVVQQMLLYTLNLNPSVGYQVNEWLALGGGVSVEYANLYQTVALPVSTIIDGQVTIKVDNTSPGFNLGAMITPNRSTKVGIAYRSQIVHHLRGNASFMNLAIMPSAATKLVMPANVIASVSQQVSDKFSLLGELGWANWSSMTNTILTVSRFSAITPNNWHDTYRIGLGGQYQALPSTLLQLGAAFDSSPTSSSNRLPDLPMDGQTRVGLGVIYGLAKAVHLGLSYEYLYLGKASINNTSSVGVLSGSYSRNAANILQASVNVDC